MNHVRRYLGLLVLATLCAMGCSKEPAPSDDVERQQVVPVADLADRVLVAGCSARVGDGVCELYDDAATITVLIGPPAQSEPQFKINSDELKPVETSQVSPKTYLYRLKPGALKVGEHTLTVLLGGAKTTQALRWVQRPKPLSNASSLKDARKTDEAIVALGSPATLAEPWRSSGYSLLGRLLLRKGETQRALKALRTGRAGHVEQQRWSDALSDGFVEAFMLINSTGELARARSLLASLSEWEDRWPEARPSLEFYRGLLQKTVGDWRGAQRHLERAFEGATRIGDTKLAKFARITRGRMKGLAGDRAAYDRYLQSELAAIGAVGGKTEPCVQERLLAYRAENAYLHAEERGAQGAPSPWEPAPRELLEKALSLAKGACGEPQRVLSNHVDLALVALQNEDTTSAMTHLAAAQSLKIVPESYIQVWLTDIQARIWVAQGQVDKAAASYAELMLRGQAMGSPEVQWRAAYGSGVTAEAGGKNARAEFHYRRAEALLDSQLAGIPSGDFGAGFMAARRQSGRRLASLLVELGRPGDAFNVLRRSATRSLLLSQRADRLAHLAPKRRARWDRLMASYRRARRGLDTLSVEDWKLTAEQLRANQTERDKLKGQLAQLLTQAREAMGAPTSPATLAKAAEGERLLGVFPWSTERWWVLEQSDSAVSHRVIAAGAQSLKTYLGSLGWDGVNRLRVLGATEGMGLDLHALVVDGRRLVEFVNVVYGLDLPKATAPAKVNSLLIVADPVGDLPKARAEGEALAKVSPLPHTLLVGDDATFTKLAEALNPAQLLHFAGHGSYAGDQSSLALAGQVPLRLGDILAFPKVPLKVVLTGCETARTKATDNVLTLGTGQAFAVSGAQEVVASTRPVDDAEAAAFAKELHAQLPSHRWELASAVAATQTALWKRQPARDWATFRVIVP